MMSKHLQARLLSLQLRVEILIRDFNQMSQRINDLEYDIVEVREEMEEEENES